MPIVSFEQLERKYGVQDVYEPNLVAPDEAERRAEESLRMAVDTNLPAAVIDDHYDFAAEEEKWLAGRIAAGQELLGKIGLAEQVARMDGSDWLERAPFSPWGMLKAVDMYLAVNRLRKNDYESLTKQLAIEPAGRPSRLGLAEWRAQVTTPEELRRRDVDLVTDFFEKQWEEQSRGRTFYAKVFDGVSYLPGWMIEFLITGGAARIGSHAAQKMALKTLRSYTATRGGRAVLRLTGWAGGAITRASLGMPHRVGEEILSRRIPKEIHFGKNNELIIDVEGDKWGTAILKGWGHVVIAAAAEETGGAVTKGAVAAANRTSLGKAILAQLAKLHPSEQVARAFTKAGWNKFVGEIGEEGVEALLHGVFDTEDYGAGKDANIFERIETAMTEFTKQLPVTAAVLVVPGATRFAAGRLMPTDVERVAREYNGKLRDALDRQDWGAYRAIRAMEQAELDQLATKPQRAGEQAELKPPEKPVELTEAERNENQLEAGMHEAIDATRQYANDDPPSDVDIPAPTANDINTIGRILHNLGIKSLDGYKPVSYKDFHNIYKFLQLPDDIRKTHPQFDPVYQVQRSREIQRAVLQHQFANMTRPYFELTDKELEKVDAALVQTNANPAKLYGPKVLQKMGLNPKQIAAFQSIREGLDTAGNILVALMKEAGVSEETVEEFRARLNNYIPHKWYGNWAVLVREKVSRRAKPLTKAQIAEQAKEFVATGEVPEIEPRVVEKPLKKPRTIFMSKTNYKDRFIERNRLKRLYPDAEVTILKSNKIRYEAFQEAPPWAVQRMLDLAAEKAQIDPQTKAAMAVALTDLYKAKGFGMHFIRRKGIPGWTENLRRPLAEYFAGFTGYVTKMQAIKAFPDALSGIHPERTRNLYEYTTEYIKYVLGDQMEFADAKRAMYFYYLFGNIKSTSLNLTQNFTLGWPVLAKHTNWALPRLLQAMSQTAFGRLNSEQIAFLDKMEKSGHFEPKLVQEFSMQVGGPFAGHLRGKIGGIITFADIFRHAETFNRRSMAIACYNAGITDINKVAGLVEEAHFRYSKGNRPILMRGYISPMMTFRSWGVNYLTWVKNEIKAKHISPLVRSALAISLFGGLTALPFFGAIVWAWRKVFGADLEAEARAVIGETIGRGVFRGVPALAGVSFSGSVSPIDIPAPRDLTSWQGAIKEIGGVWADVPERVFNVNRSLARRNYLRALEDAAPEFLRNPLSAYRGRIKGTRTRSGRYVLDVETARPLQLTTEEAVKKAFGFYPVRLAEQSSIRAFVRGKEMRKQKKIALLADRYHMAALLGDVREMEKILDELGTHNYLMEKRGRQDDKISDQEFDEAIERHTPVGFPAKKWEELLVETVRKYGGQK